MKFVKYIGFIMVFLAVTPMFAHIDPNRDDRPVKNNNPEVNFREDCQAPEAQVDMDINNVRARLLTGGDLWWDLDDGKYIVPNVPIGSGIPEVSSLFAGGVWLGGLDPADNLKLASCDYRGNGRQDFYAGPLDPENGQTDAPICSDWDDFFTVFGDDIRKTIKEYDRARIAGLEFPCDSVSDGMLGWPGRGNPNFPGPLYDFELPDTGQGLGSFWDEDGDGDYDPCKGDFPIIDIRGCEPETRDKAKELVPDQMIFWIYNDAGGPHSLSTGAALNMEVQVQAFAYATNDEINDMTFYRYKLINRGATDLRNTYFAMWVDPDLGCHEDDFSGCDIERSLAYTYNEDILDGSTGCNCAGGVNTYCDQVPIIGTDYFRGPLSPRVITDEASGEAHVLVNADRFDENVYAEGDTIYVRDLELGETMAPDVLIELGMSSFIYYNNPSIGNPSPQTTDPSNAIQRYNYLQGLWNDGTPVTFGGTGFNPGSMDVIKYAFPGDPDNVTDWSMCTSGLGFGDRRTLQASGPFLLQPGATNELIVGAVWVPDLDYPCPDISKLQNADDLAQALFDACFDIIDGPDAPDVCAIELDREVILVLSNDTILSNNAFEMYEEVDILAPDEIDDSEKTYNFEGYKIYQLENAAVSAQELGDIDKARILAQVDVKNGVTEIFNWSSVVDPNPASNELIWIPESKVEGLDQGIKNTIQITEDLFASGDSRLINHKKYYYLTLAYGYNNYAQFDPDDGTGQRTPYLEGRGNIRTLTVIPRPIIYENQNASFNDGAIVTRLDGVGLGNNFVDLADDMYDKILEGTTNREITYKEGAGPIEVKIYNPLEVQDGTFILEILGDHQGGAACGLQAGATWRMTHEETGNVVESDRSIDVLNEQLLADYGFSIAIAQTEEAGSGRATNNGAINAVLEYPDPTGVNWYGAIRDDGAGFDPEVVQPFLNPIFNFLKTGNGEPNFAKDMNQDFSALGDGLFYPFTLTSGESSEDPNAAFGGFFVTPAWKNNNSHGFVASNDNGLENLNNVDIVFTNDKTKWSRCIVIETASEDYALVAQTQGDDVSMFDLRDAPSVDENGEPDGDGNSMSWFPGYAVDVETGERLNIFFGENSTFNADFAAENINGGNAIGTDMMYNPNSQIFSMNPTTNSPLDLVLGGGHYVYVTREPYDRCQGLREQLEPDLLANFSGRINALKGITWASMSLLRTGSEMLHYADGAVPNDLIVKLRVDNPYNLEKEFNITAPTGCVTTGSNPKYRFVISGKQSTDLTDEEFTGALDNIGAVPNPYYGLSAYETSQFSTTVKITNLPARCDITIYSLDGKFIRQFRRDERGVVKNGSNPSVSRVQELPDVEWDLKNYSGVPIASGVYLIHVFAPEEGVEKTIKWFGVNRQFDPSGL